MTPDTIITADSKCPRCDAPFSHFEGVNTRVFLCGSIAQRAYTACNYAATLRARVLELEDWIKSLDEIGSHSGKSDARELNGDMGWIYPDTAVYYGPKKPTGKVTK